MMLCACASLPSSPSAPPAFTSCPWMHCGAYLEHDGAEAVALHRRVHAQGHNVASDLAAEAMPRFLLRQRPARARHDLRTGRNDAAPTLGRQSARAGQGEGLVPGLVRAGAGAGARTKTRSRAELRRRAEARTRPLSLCSSAFVLAFVLASVLVLTLVLVVLNALVLASVLVIPSSLCSSTPSSSPPSSSLCSSTPLSYSTPRPCVHPPLPLPRWCLRARHRRCRARARGPRRTPRRTAPGTRAPARPHPALIPVLLCE